MSQKPVILLTFANNLSQAGAYLSELNKERNELQEILNANNLYACEVLSEANINRIIQSLRKYKKAIQVFHYSGHAFEQGLELNERGGQNRVAFVDGMANLIELLGGVKMVFLNGCYTEKQIDKYHQAGVSIVIGTTYYVKDEVAREFSESFYRNWIGGETVRVAFEIAKSKLKIKYAHPQQYLHTHPETGQTWRELDWKEQPSPAATIDPYMLSFVKAEDQEAKAEDWAREYQHKQQADPYASKFPTAKPKAFHPHIFQRCDRKAQMKAFEQCLLKQRAAAIHQPHFFFVYGPLEELPDSFVYNIKTYLLPELLKPDKGNIQIAHEKIEFPEKGDVTDKEKAEELPEKEAFKQSFYIAFTQLQGYFRKKLGISSLRQVIVPNILSMFPRKVDVVIIEHQIVMSQWYSEMGKFMEAYMKNFWLHQFPEKGPQVIVIFSIVYEHPSAWYQKIRFFHPVAKLEEGLMQVQRQVSACTILEELGKVHREDLIKWQRAYLAEEVGLIEEVFANERLLSMKMVQKKLKPIVDRYVEQWRKEHVRGMRLSI